MKHNLHENFKIIWCDVRTKLFPPSPYYEDSLLYADLFIPKIQYRMLVRGLAHMGPVLFRASRRSPIEPYISYLIISLRMITLETTPSWKFKRFTS